MQGLLKCMPVHVQRPSASALQLLGLQWLLYHHEKWCIQRCVLKFSKHAQCGWPY